jgi:hypothetical protein
MVSQLHATTRPLFQQLVFLLLALPLGLPFGRLQRVALYIAGLILLDRDQTACRIARYLPGRRHDALNYLLRRGSFSAQMLMRGLALWAKSLGPGFFSLDDVVVEKPWSRLLPWVGWAYSTTRKGKVRGMVIVVLFWSNGVLRIPVAFRLWRPKERCLPGEYRTKLQLAQEVVQEALTWGLRPTYIVFDAWYNARRFTRMLARHRLVWVSVLKANARVRPHHYYCSVSRFASRLAKDTSIQGFHVRLRGYGKVKLVVVRNGATIQYLVTNALRSPPQEVLRRKRSRWDAEESFRDAKQLAGLEACQARVPQAAQRHIALVLLSLVALQLLKRDPSETAGQVKERFQLLSITGALHAFPPKTFAKTA